jgi:hypothetical protein
MCIPSDGSAGQGTGAISMDGTQYLFANIALLIMVAAAQFVLCKQPDSGVPGAPLALGRGNRLEAASLLKIPAASNHDALVPSNQAIGMAQPIGLMSRSRSIHQSWRRMRTPAGA